MMHTSAKELYMAFFFEIVTSVEFIQGHYPRKSFHLLGNLRLPDKIRNKGCVVIRGRKKEDREERRAAEAPPVAPLTTLVYQNY